MGSFEQSMEEHSRPDARTIEILERSMGASKPVDARDACAKCGGHRYGREPWCQRCARDHAAEYAPIYRAWILERPGQHLAAAGVPPHFQGCSLASYQIRTPEQRRVVDAVRVWAAGDTSGLYLLGPPGVGKTHLATAALLDRLASRRTGRYVSTHDLLLEARESYDDGNRPLSKILDECGQVDALVIDDLAAEKVTQFASSSVFLPLVDRAYSRQGPQLIVTSNLDLAALGRKTDERIADRLRELCVVVKVGGASHRRRVAAARVEGRGAQISGGSSS